MFRIFLKKSAKRPLPFKVDLHSHLLPGLDDGVKSIEETIYILKSLEKLGYEKVITTPHVMSDHYPNSDEQILIRFNQVNRHLEKHNLNIRLEAAAEYFLDEQMVSRINKGEKLLSFNDNYLLFETAFINKPAYMEEAIFMMNTNGYRPVLAHPERYVYMHSNRSLIERLKNMNVLFQINLLSLFGYYSPEVKKSAQYLLKLNAVNFIGTDCHSALQVDEIVNLAGKSRGNPLHKLKFENQSLL